MAGFALCAACRAEYDEPARPPLPRAADRVRRVRSRARAVGSAQGPCSPGAARRWPQAAAAIRRRATSSRSRGSAASTSCATRRSPGGGAAAPAQARLEKPFALMARDLAQARTLCAIDARPSVPVRSGMPHRAAAAPCGRRGRGQRGARARHARRDAARDAAPPPAAARDSRVRSWRRAATSPTSRSPRTSARRSSRLGHVADLFLVHDRPIERHGDDSIGWTLDGALLAAAPRARLGAAAGSRRERLARACSRWGRTSRTPSRSRRGRRSS